MTGIWEELPDELYIIGDIHGDFYALKQALELTSCVIFEDTVVNDIVKQYGEDIILIDGCEYYTANLEEPGVKIYWNQTKINCSIVFAGDLIDRCRNLINNTCQHVVHDEDCDYKILKLLIDLNNQALQYNSRIIIVLGNHEIMNIGNKLNYLSRKAINSNQRLENINNLIKNNLNNVYGIIRINNYIICHGGINPIFLEQNKVNFNNNKEFIEHYNIHLRNFLVDINYEFNYLITHKNSPFWDRTNGSDNLALSDIDCKKIFEDNILNIKKNINNIKIIVAHCPQIINLPQMGINLVDCGSYKNKIWRVDIAMSRAFDNYVNETLLDILLNQINERINNNQIDLDFILSFNINRESKLVGVQILKITNQHEEIIMGIKSLDYFYKDVFKNNFNLMMLYLLQDILSNYSHLFNNANQNNIIYRLQKLKDIFYRKLFNSNVTNYYVRQTILNFKF